MKQPPLDEAKALIVKGELDAAIPTLSELLNAEFFDPDILFLLGACFLAKGFNGLSAVITSAAIDGRAARKKPFPEALGNLASAYKAEHKNEIAERIWGDALRLEALPHERAKLLVNMSGLYINEGNPEPAIALCDKALAEDPGDPGAKANRGMACLELGRWREGWAGWLSTYDTNDRNERRYLGVPKWDGAPGKTVIVWGDQGVGDEIYYANSLADMQARCKKVILDCHPRLEALFRRSFPEIEVHGTRKHLSELDWFPGCGAEASFCLSDLPSVFRNEDGEWRGAPYIKADLDVAGNLSAGNEQRRRIGISWTGGTKRTRTELRTVPLALFEPLIRAMPGADWFSLQYTPDAAREVCEFEEQTGLRVSHYPGWVECFDYDRTASFVASLDLVITVCTSVHHLAGALGVPTWTLVPSRPSWRYGNGLKSETLPWYDSVRLFRQQKDEGWPAVIERVGEALAETIGMVSPC